MMQLLYDCPVPSAEFASLSLLVSKPRNVKGGSATKQSQKSHGSLSDMTSVTSTIGDENLMAVSPTATVAQHVAHAGINELHDYLADMAAVGSQPHVGSDDKKESDSAGATMNGVSNNHNETTIPTRLRRQRRPLRPRSSNAESSRKAALRNDASTLFGEEGNASLSPVHCFRPSGVGGCSGLGLHYAIVRDAGFVKTCASLLLLPSSISSLSSSSSSGKNAPPTPAAKKLAATSSTKKGIIVNGNAVELIAVVLCIGVTGAPRGQFPSPVLHFLPCKIQDCFTLLRRLAISTATATVSGKREEQYRRCARSLLNAVLLDEEEIKTNDAAEVEYNPDVLGGLASADYTGAITSSGVKASAITKKFAFSNVKTAMSKKKTDAKKKGPPVLPSATSATSSADVARIVTEQLQILSLAEKDMPLKPYEVRQKVRKEMEEKAASRSGGRAAAQSIVGTSRSPARPKIRVRRAFSNVTGGGLSLSELSAFDYTGQESRTTVAAGSKGVSPSFPFRPGGGGATDGESSSRAAKSSDSSVKSGFVPTIMAPRNDSSARARLKAMSRPSRNRPAPISSRKTSTGSVSVISFGQNWQVTQGAAGFNQDASPMFNANFDGKEESLIGAVVGSRGGKKDSRKMRSSRQENYRRKNAASTERRGNGVIDEQSPFGTGEKGRNMGINEEDDMASIGSNSVRSNHSIDGIRGNANLPHDSNGEGGRQNSTASSGKKLFDPFALSEDGGNTAENEAIESWKGSAPSTSMLSVVDEVSYTSGVLDSPPPTTSHKSVGSSDIPRTKNQHDSDLSGIGDDGTNSQIEQQSTPYGARPEAVVRDITPSSSDAVDGETSTSMAPSHLGEASDQVDDSSKQTRPTSPLQQQKIDSSELHVGGMVVNLALNEDLSCSYKQSKISSCSIEGIVQVQIKAESHCGVPFSLLLRDSSRHIRAIQENKKYAKITSDETQQNVKTDHKFILKIPKADSYFPIMRYKCSSELRPVPIRVQTRVRLHGSCCRVALQISSNPANEDDLSDLTIIMAVPTGIIGETLTTSPPGGVWNAEKRSVLWCVAELGDGEKFQLQAQFEMEKSGEESFRSEKPSFPVLVRCQCMYAQLSNIEFEVGDVPEAPAEVTMRLARRFRLSHREKS